MGPMFCYTKKEMRDRIPEVGQLDFAADFADDGVDGGDYEAVFKVLEKEIELGPEYGLRNNYDKMVVYPLAGIDLREISPNLLNWDAKSIIQVTSNSCRCRS